MFRPDSGQTPPGRFPDRYAVKILLVEDDKQTADYIAKGLREHGHVVDHADNGRDGLYLATGEKYDVLIVDRMLPIMDGLSLVKAARASGVKTPALFLTTMGGVDDRVAGLEAGGDDYLTKPVDHGALIVRVRAMLRIKALHDEVHTLNKGLEEKVNAQVDELQRVSRLRGFLAPQLAHAIVSAGDEKILENHRREVVAMFCDLRGFTAFSETAEPEDIMAVLNQYHGAVGPLIRKYEGTLDRFTGDGMMVFFNDPLPCEDAPQRAARLALEMRDAVAALMPGWSRRGHRLGLGIGMAQGYATLGRIGFEDRFDYTAIGAVINLAARLCSEAADGQVLVSGRLAAEIEELADMEHFGEREIRGMARPVAVANLRGLKV